ncbi:tRNA pseudouridine(55) synthase [Theileria orientalis]|uniref:tRNA pseudouridine(55) synthase n=1 Tax=Theileria orientalis TaxID=68886 RepID=A0A976MC47_THEOR|nr:tRNA pseudouridine(55) synthase [Theileria orientalis]
MENANCISINDLFSNTCCNCFKNLISAIKNSVDNSNTGDYNVDNIVINNIENKSFVEKLLNWEDYAKDLSKICIVCKSCKLNGEILLFKDIECINFVSVTSNYEKEVELDNFDPFEFYFCFKVDEEKIGAYSDINNIINHSNSSISSYSNKIYKGFDFGIISVYLSSEKSYDNFKNNLISVNIIRDDERNINDLNNNGASNSNPDVVSIRINLKGNGKDEESNENININIRKLAELRIRELVLEFFLNERLKFIENNPRAYENFENLCKDRLVLEQLIRLRINTSITLNRLNGAYVSSNDYHVKCKFSISRDVVSFMGYYNKFSRCISQTEWIINDRDILSVEELIGEPLLKVTRGKKFKLVGCGREDVDVRNLGNGRKILMEIYKTRVDLFLIIHSLQLLTADSGTHYNVCNSATDTVGTVGDDTSIVEDSDTDSGTATSGIGTVSTSIGDNTGMEDNYTGNSMGIGSGNRASVAVGDNSGNKLLKNYFIKPEMAPSNDCVVMFKCIGMTFNNKNVRKQIQNQSELNSKSYNCLIFSEEKLSYHKVKEIENYEYPLAIKQSNPIRISHRRAQDVRNKVIYDLKLDLIHPRVILMYIETQAGLYVKEFVNGDLGRTNPSLKGMLKTKLHVVKLDVINIKR